MFLFCVIYFLLVSQGLVASSLASEGVKQPATDVISSIKKYPIFVSLEQQYGNKQTALVCQGVIPFYQELGALFFIVPSGNVALDGTLDGEMGLGYRKHFAQHIIGFFGYGALKKTACNHLIPQLTLGAECFFSLVELTFNCYLPQKKSLPIKGNDDVGITMKGFDLVGGVTLPNMPWKGWLSYSYLLNKTYYASGVHGGQAKIQYHFTDWFGMDLAYGYNTLKQHDISVGITLNNWLFHKNNEQDAPTHTLTDMDKKMIQIAVRPMVRKTFFVKHKQETVISPNIEIKNKTPGGNGHAVAVPFQDRLKVFVQQTYEDSSKRLGGVGVKGRSASHAVSHHYFSHFEESISLLRQMADEDRGIKSMWDHKQKIYYRDATNAHNQKTIYSSADYVIHIASLCRAAHIICHIHDMKVSDFDGIMKELMKKYAKDETYRQQGGQFWVKEQKEYYLAIVTALCKYFPMGKNENKDHIVGNMLRITESFGGLRDPHYDVVTVFKINNDTFVQKDERVFAKKIPNKELFTKRESHPWYTGLTAFEKKLMDRSYQFLIDGAHITPHNFRNIPSLKNAYKKMMFVLDKDNNEVPLGSYYHSGMLPLFLPSKDGMNANKDDMKEAEEYNWKQIKNQESNMIFLSLNSRGNFPGGVYESYIVDRTKEIMKDAFINIPVNFWRKFSKGFCGSKIKIFFDRVMDHYGADYPKVRSCIEEHCADQAYKAAQEEIKQKRQQIKDNDEDKKRQIRFLEEITVLSKLLRSNTTNNKNESQSSTFEVRHNENARMAAQFVALSSVFRQRTNIGDPVMFSCKSGKDRTGYISWLVDADMIKLYYPDIDRNTLYYNLASAGHVQYLAACNGGLPGRFGFKPVATDKPSRDQDALFVWEIYKKLFLESAKHTNVLYKKDIDVWDKFKIWCYDRWEKKTLAT